MSVRDTSPRVYVHTLGCAKNEADSRTLRHLFAAAGLIVTDTLDTATHVLINTCGFIQDAKEESIGAILDACAGYPDKAIVVVGCLVERFREELCAGIPEVAGWFGLLGCGNDGELIRMLSGEVALGEAGTASGGEGTPSTPTGGPSSWAYLKISDGCDEPCTFCAIPGIKGGYYSHSAADIEREAGACLAEGCRELVLVGQDTSLWSEGGLDLTGLVERLAADRRVERIRVMYLQPDHVTDAFLCYMAGQPKLCRYLDVPFQHSHPEILRRMGRTGEGDSYLELLERARCLMPDVTVRSTFIVGFPGETEEQFEDLLDFVEEAGFDYAGGFVYSPEEGTVAAGLKPRVRKTLAQQRLNRLNSVLVRCSEQKHQALVGSRMEVILDSVGPGEMGEGIVAIGRTEGQAPEVDGVTYIEGKLPDGVAVGELLTVTITAAAGYDLIGTCHAS